MKESNLAFDLDQAISWLMRFLAVEGTTGQEAAIGQEVVKVLLEVGVPREAIHFDKANEKIPLPTQTGNLIVTLPGTQPGPRWLFMTHLDTVPLCAGAKPVRKGNRIIPAGPTALGADNRTGCTTLVNMIANLIKNRLPHPPLTVLFTVREESGLWGARFVDLAELGNPVMGFNVDGRSAADITIGAVGADKWDAEIIGIASHAGVHPEQGISATVVASMAMAEVYKGGWFGKIKHKTGAGTSNIGSFGGKDGQSAGIATNVLTDYAHLRGEARSHDVRFIKEIVAAYKNAFRKATQRVKNYQGKKAQVRFQARHEYFPFRLKENSPVVRHAQAAAERAGLLPNLRMSNGGLDANWLVRHGLPTITFGAGQNNVHMITEYVDLSQFEEGCRMALALATL